MVRIRLCLVAAIMVATPVAAHAQLPELEGSSWLVAGETEMGGRFISFAGDGRFSGFGGCNRIMGRYEVKDGQLTIGVVGSTRMACAEDVMAKEAEFIALLGKTRGATVEGTALRLLDEAGNDLATLEQRAP